MKDLQKSEALFKCPLAGGTSLALQLGHRVSIDLDFFGSKNLNFEDVIRLLESYDDALQLSASNSVITWSVQGVKIDVVRYDYPLLTPLKIEEGVVLYGLEDIAAMKLEAIKGRGRRRDFYDLYFLLKVFDIREIMSFNVNKFKGRDPFLVVKSLSYFADAELDPLVVVPSGIDRVDWEVVKTRMIEAAKNLL